MIDYLEMCKYCCYYHPNDCHMICNDYNLFTLHRIQHSSCKKEYELNKKFVEKLSKNTYNNSGDLYK
jgi:hypothetical protein